MRKAKAAVLYKPFDLRVEEVEVREPADDEVVIRVKAVGICGSDIHFYKEGKIGKFVVEKPLILGHEAAGEIVEVGKGVKERKVGDRVAIEPGIPCRKCEYCKGGRYNLCPDMKFLSCPPYDGFFVEFAVVPWDFTFILPEGISFEEGAMVEPLSVGMQAAKRSGVSAGDTVAILGAGPIGLCTLQVVKAFGASPIIITDVVPFRLELAKKMGATYVINAKEEDVVAKINELTNGRGVDVTFECAGQTATTQITPYITKPGGVITLVGVTSEEVYPMPMLEIAHMRELDVRGVFRYANVHSLTVKLLGEGKLDAKPLITHSFSLDQAKEALDFVDKNKDKVIKGVIKP